MGTYDENLDDDVGNDVNIGSAQLSSLLFGESNDDGDASFDGSNDSKQGILSIGTTFNTMNQ